MKSVSNSEYFKKEAKAEETRALIALYGRKMQGWRAKKSLQNDLKRLAVLVRDLPEGH